MGDTLNGLGSLKQKQKAYHDAEKIFRRSLEIRERLPEGEDHGKAKEQTIAQSLVSLGNLFIEMGDAFSAGNGNGKSAAGRGVEEQQVQYSKALEMLERAKEAYVKGFAEGHPKVAWALEGMGKVHSKMRWAERYATLRNVCNVGCLWASVWGGSTAKS